ncbi:AsmA-like C-terminal region-containing protein [Blastopirellula sp. JC732]|uniref:AsmA-like C-terminal region-containing protein n=1 Tax=Blastopirellula sediminis TaxID=2894196 RepID=A0A9X1MRE5_9BACT|nr:AsmA-like C-terminal region-containing protein [Blastopirellula sediminis]MCC9605705.1 AsmA-like C-terminal region-containing protein [Blastopirellula sediminis]MCC9630995.1 AsmA-like C-terminal region-containing protein [Blastopirellula sediminis]
MTDETPKKRSWFWWIFCAFGAIVLFVAALPTLVSYRPLTQGGLSAVLAASEVEVMVDRVSLGWLTPTRIEGLKIHQREDKFEVSVPKMRNDVYFWQLIVNPRQLGNLEIIKPNLHFIIQKKEDSLIDSVASEPAPIDQKNLSEALNRQVSVEIQDATLSANRPGGAEWKIEHFDLSGHLTPSTDDHGPLLKFDHIQAMHHFKLTEEMCDDLLKYAVPIMHGVTNVNGEASLRFEEWEFPLDNPKAGSGHGTLEIHHASLIAGPVVRSVTDALQMAPTVQIADNCQVDFKLENGRIYHDGLEIGLPNCRVKTSGSVGLDDTLDILCVIPVPLDKTINEETPILNMLRGKTLRLKITGTLQQPIVGLADSPENMTETLLGNIQDGDIPVEEVLGAATGMLRRMREEMPNNPLQRLRTNPDPQADVPETPPIPRPLGGLFDRLRQGISGAIENGPPLEEEPPPPPPEPEKKPSSGAPPPPRPESPSSGIDL